MFKEQINEEEFEECPYCRAVAYLDHGPSKFCFNCYFTYAPWLPVSLTIQMRWHEATSDIRMWRHR